MNLLIGVSVASLLGTNVIARATNSVVQHGIDALYFVRAGSSSSGKIRDAMRKIDELDIKMKMKVLRKFLDKPKENKFDPLYIICEDMDTILDNCCSILKNIDQIIHDHNTKWFKGYRTFDVSEELAELEIYNNIMKNRIELFILENDM